jgi:3-hydroxymyristoyl/3-hydroxydecanoyl-(acyl carrier protein) dehydratase
MTINALPVSSEEILKLIDVGAPYYALENLIIDTDGSVCAKVPIEQDLYYEPLPISSSETGRHLAVLGSCACALNNPDKTKHYYLAASANATRKDFCFDNEEPEYFLGYARCIKVDSRSAQVITMLKYPDGTLFSEIVINYHVLDQRIFERINQEKLIVDESLSYNPYITEPSARYTPISEKQLFGVLENIRVNDCAGHFPGLPAVPISILFRVLVKFAIVLMQNKIGNPNAVFCVRECTTEAKNLAFPGEEIDVNARFIHTDEKNQHFVKVSAYTNCDCCVGTTELILIEVK